MNLKALQQKWYSRLKKEGFVDIESSRERLKNSDSIRFVRKDSRESHHITYQSLSERFDYFNRAGQFLHEYRFKNRIEKKIWHLHADGTPIRKIAEDLKLVSAGSQNSVHSVINRLQETMRTWDFDSE